MGRRRLFAARLLPLLPLLAGGDSRGGGPVHQLLFARVATFLVGPPVSERLSLSSSSSSSTTWGALGIVEKVARKQTSLRATPREVEVEEQGDSYTEGTEQKQTSLRARPPREVEVEEQGDSYTEVTEEGDLYSEFSDEAYEEEHDADAGDHLPRMYYNFDATTTSTSRAGDDPEDELEQPREQEDESTLLQEQGLPCCAPPLPPPAAPAPTSSADSLRRQASRQTSQIGATAVTNYRTVAPASAASLKVKGAGGGARDVDELVDAGGTRNIMLESCRGGKAIGVAAVTADHEKCRKNMDWEDDSEHPEEAERQRKAACHPEHLSNCADRVHKGHFAHCTIDEKIAAFKHKFPACDHDKDKHGKYQVPLDYARCFEEVLCGLYGRAKRYDWNSTWTSDKDNDFPDPGEVAFKFRDWNWEDTSEAFRHFEDSGDVHDADPDAYHGCRKTCRGCSNDTHLDIDGSDPMNNHVHKRKHDDPRISDTLDHGELGCLCTPIRVRHKCFNSKAFPLVCAPSDPIVFKWGPKELDQPKTNVPLLRDKRFKDCHEQDKLRALVLSLFDCKEFHEDQHTDEVGWDHTLHGHSNSQLTKCAHEILTQLWDVTVHWVEYTGELTDAEKTTTTTTSTFYNSGGRVKLKPYGVLGLQRGSNGKRKETRIGDPPDETMAILDPAGPPLIDNKPQDAGAASGAIYKFLKNEGGAIIHDANAFPSDVHEWAATIHDDDDDDTLLKEFYNPDNADKGLAKFHSYDNTKVVHVVAPDFRKYTTGPPDGDATYYNVDGGPGHDVDVPNKDDAATLLAKAYTAALSEAAQKLLPPDEHPHKKNPEAFDTLRLAPVSGGIFAGKFKNKIFHLTAKALDTGFENLEHPTEKEVLLRSALSVELCIYEESEDDDYETAVRNWCSESDNKKRGWLCGSS